MTDVELTVARALLRKLAALADQRPPLGHQLGTSFLNIQTFIDVLTEERK